MASEPGTDIGGPSVNRISAAPADHAVAAPASESPTTPAPTAPSGYFRIVLLVMGAGVGFAYWRAWVCDDAFITFRHVSNCLAGHGPVFNVGERVQGFTHPLWFLLLLAGSSVANMYAMVVAMGIVATGALLGAVGLFLRHGRQPVARLLLVALLLLGSHTFVEYQTSGLETGLSHLLVALLWGWLLRAIEQDRPIPVMGPAVLGALLMLNRPDHVFLCTLPMLGLLVVALRRHRLGGLLRLVPAGVLLVAWYGFATVYYGTPFPNTAYAKAGLAQTVLWHRGLGYVVDYARSEPVQAAFVGLAILLAVAIGVRGLIARRRGAGMLLCLALAVVLHVAYVVHMGGDFMRGRFLGVTLVAGVLLSQHVIGRFLPDRNIARACLLALTMTGLAICVNEPGRVLLPAALIDGFLRLSDQLYYTPIWTTALAASLITVLATGIRVFSRSEYRPWGPRVFAATALVLGLYTIAIIGQLQSRWLSAAALVICLGVVTYALALFASRRAVRLSSGLACLVMVLAAGGTLSGIRPRTASCAKDPGIADEYLWYAGSRTAPRFREPGTYPGSRFHEWAREGQVVREYARMHGPITLYAGVAGQMGYHAGPDVHVVDCFGLVDAFVARCTPSPKSRIGHLEYDIPEGYLESLGAVTLLPDWEQRLRDLDPSLAEDARKMARDARWADPEARRRYDQTKLVVSGHLWSKERWVAILDFAWPIR